MAGNPVTDMGASSLTVVKVGGSLLADQAGVLRAASEIAERRHDGVPLLVVASALKGVTDLLEEAAVQALDRHLGDAPLERTLATLWERHESIARGVTDDRVSLSQVRGILGDVEDQLAAIRSTGELPDSAFARLLSAGERLSVTLLATAVRAAGEDARSITAEKAGVRAVGPPCAGLCDLAGSVAGFREVERRLRNQVLVLTGFYGVDERGGVILFGRGGSDDTACAVAAILDAERLELWKDVPGFMSADPQEVRRPRVVAELSFDEVAQLGAFGSSIVHHGCLEPLRGHTTKIFICSLRGVAGSCAGTRLRERTQRPSPQVVALASRHGRTELRLTCESNSSVHDTVRELMGSLVDAKIPVGSLGTEKRSLHFTIPDHNLEEVRHALKHRNVEVRRSTPLVGVVGNGIADDPKISSRMFGCLSSLKIRGDLVAQPSGHAGLSCAIHHEDLTPALSGLHEHFFATA